MKEPPTSLAMSGLEIDNLLSLLALLGLLRSLEAARPEWHAKACWLGAPLVAQLRVNESVTLDDVATAAAEGIDLFVKYFDFGECGLYGLSEQHANVDFTHDEYRSLAKASRSDPIASAVAAALCAQLPKRDKGTEVQVSPLVMMFGQGHQNFLQRFLTVPRGDLPKRLEKSKHPPDLRSPAKIAEALFAPWVRADKTDGFRWDPEDDQRYALRFDDPSGVGAAPTVHGANRLAALGLLSYPCFPLSETSRQPRAPGIHRERRRLSFVWPVWCTPLSLVGIEALLAHPDVAAGQASKLRVYGVEQLYAAPRVSNGKFLNVARAMPWQAVSAVSKASKVE